MAKTPIATAVKTLTFFRPEDVSFVDDRHDPSKRMRRAIDSLDAQGPGEGEHALESLLLGAQHREDRVLRVASMRNARAGLAWGRSSVH